MRNRNWSLSILCLVGAVTGCGGCQQSSPYSDDVLVNVDGPANEAAQSGVDLGKLAEEAVAETSAELNGQETAAAPPSASDASPGSEPSLEDLAAAADEAAESLERDAQESEQEASNLIQE